MKNTVPPTAAADETPAGLHAELCALRDELRLTLEDHSVSYVPSGAWLAVGELTAAIEHLAALA
jgi:hypothetical protein